MKTAEGRKELLDGLIKSGAAAQLPEIFWRSFQGTTENLIVDKKQKDFIKQLKKDKDTIVSEEGYKETRGYAGNLLF